MTFVIYSIKLASLSLLNIEQGRDQVDELAQAGKRVTRQSVEITFACRGSYSGSERPRQRARKSSSSSPAKRGFVSLPRCSFVECSWLAMRSGLLPRWLGAHLVAFVNLMLHQFLQSLSPSQPTSISIRFNDFVYSELNFVKMCYRMLLFSVARNSILLLVLDMCCNRASIASMPR